MIHVYHGDGKGKTTAAVGISIRAVGAGRNVCFAQFLKDDTSSEIKVLRDLTGVQVMHAKEFYGFTKNMTEEQKIETKKEYEMMIKNIDKYVEKHSTEDNQKVLVVLDEILHVLNSSLVDGEMLLQFLDKWKDNESVELVLTGRNPYCALLEKAHYVTEMKKEKHPFDGGIFARIGVEF